MASWGGRQGGYLLTDLRPEFTPTEALRRFERQWRDQLGAVTLAGELDVKHADAVLILQTLIRQQRRDSRVLERYPACVVVSLASCARRIYRGGALWDGLFEAIGERRQQHLEAMLGEAFLEGLEELGKPAPHDSHFRFVSAMALHACIPDYCIGDLLRLVAARQEASPGIDGSSFISWATGLGGSTRIGSLDRPVRDFLTTGDDFAIDLIDRSLDLLDLLRRGERHPDQLLSGSGAPQRFIDWSLQSLDDSVLELRPISGLASQTTQIVLPHVVLDLDRWSVLLRLPPVASHGRAWWNVTLDRAHRRVNSVPSGSHLGADAPTDMVVDTPSRSVGVSLGTSEHRYDLDLVDAAAPVVAFDHNGTFLPMGVPLPSAMVWLLHPAVSEACTLRVIGDGQLVSEAMGPIGWNGWSLTHADLSGARGIEVNGSIRPVRGSAKANLVVESPLRGIRTADGGTIVAQRPTIDIPMSTADRDWTFEVRDAQTGEMLQSQIWTIPAISEEDDSHLAQVDPFDEWPAPVVGSFDLLARGPLGTRGTWRVHLCEGLRLVPSVECRTFVPGGLTPMTVRLDSTSGLHREPSLVEFGAADLASGVSITGAEGALDVEVEPDHLEVCHSHEGGGSTDWSSQPLALPTDSSDPLGMLQVRMPTQRAIPPLTLTTPGGMKQTLAAHKGGPFGLHRFNLARLSDTLKVHKDGDLGWDFGSEQTTLVRFRPDRLASAVSILSGDIVLEDFSGAANVVAGMYYTLAPWRDPVVVSFDAEGTAPCPPELQDAGPLKVELRVDDPWVPSAWEKWPRRPLTVRQPGQPVSTNLAESAVIAYLAQEAPIPSRDGSLPFLWSLLELGGDLLGAGLPRRLAEDVEIVFRGRPHAAVRALGFVRVDRSVALRAAIRLGFVEHVLSLSTQDATSLWSSHPALAACAASDEDAPTDAMVTRCGDSASILLSGQDDPHALIGRFTDSLVMDGKPSAVIEQMLQAGGIVPAGLLDEGTRVQNANQMFSARTHWSLLDAAKYSQPSIDAAIDIIRTSGYQRLASLIESRPESTIHRPWQRLPQMSLLNAALARLGSRGCAPALRALDEVREGWTAMTRTATPFVEMDIILAELLIISEDVRRAADITDEEGSP